MRPGVLHAPDAPGIIAVVAAVLVLLVCPPVLAATPQQIQDTIDRTKQYIYSQQQNGTWEKSPRDPENRSNLSSGGQWGGTTALAVYALLASGENPQDPRLKPAIEFLMREKMVGVYALGVRCQVWYFLPQSPQIKALMAQDAQFLLNMINGPDTKIVGGIGQYGYVPGTSSYSHSRSQYAVLGIWAAAQTGVPIPIQYWKFVEQSWLNNQDPSGGWSYMHPQVTTQPVTPGMTAAGVASLYIMQDYLYANRGLDCRPSAPVPSDLAIEAGMKWLADNMDKIASNQRFYKNRDFPIVTLYGIERIGVASGRKYIGSVDWFSKGADWLVTQQNRNGSFPADYAGWIPALPSSCFALLFLTRGGAPILMNKLEYANEGQPDAVWNHRRRDLANVARWVSLQSEKEYNWQIVQMESPEADWHDAPILYIAGNEALKLPDEHKQKLKNFVEQGGLILAVADCNSRPFTESFRKLLKELFPDYQLRILPEDHLIYTSRFQRSHWRGKPQVMGLSNGVRELALIVASGDPARDWQTGTIKGKEASWELAANIYQYAVVGAGRHYRGFSSWVQKDDTIKPAQSIALARIQTAGNWNPEPGGWQRLAAQLHNRYAVELVSQVVKLDQPLTDVKVAHLTGTDDLSLTAQEQAHLKKFVEDGGTLVIDAAGGQGAFASAAEKILTEMFPQKKLETIDENDALYKAGDESQTAIAWRFYTRHIRGSALHGPHLQGIRIDDRWGVIYSREDLSAGLVGNETDGIAGYTPATATRLMTQILFHATNIQAKVITPVVQPIKKKTK